MAMTDEQYKQILRYVDGEMDTDEQKKFEAALVENKELSDEVKFYKEIRLLSESVEQKTSSTDLFLSEEKKRDSEEVWTMINNARKNWENQYEDDLKLKYEITAGGKDIPEEEQKNNTRGINISKWLIAATLAGIAALGMFWWYLKTTKDNNQIVVNNKAGDSVIINNKKTDSVSKTDLPIISDSSRKRTFEQNLAERRSEKIKALFENNFKPDAAPPDKEGPLESAFVNYENKAYEKASMDFERADIGPVTRGYPEDNRKLMAFYIHYYKALSYMAANSDTLKTFSELRKAIDTSPDKAWKGKAQWYLALVYLKNGHTKIARTLLKQVAVNNDVKELRQKAISLSKELREE
jgi:hypothetical protein